MILFLLLSIPGSFATLTMVTIWGYVEDSSFFFDKTPLEWDECVSTCFSTTNCMVAYKSGEAGSLCVTYMYGDVLGVMGFGDRDKGDKVSIKIDTNSEECLETPTAMLTYQTFKSFASSTYYPTYQFIISETIVIFSYTDSKYLSACWDWLDNPPSCNSGCTRRIKPLNAFVYGSPRSTPVTETAGTWRHCMALCYDRLDCFMVTMGRASTDCRLYVANFNSENYFIMKSSPEEGLKVAFVVSVDATTCKLTTMEALNGFTYKVTGVYETLVYQIRTSSIAYGIYRTTEGCSTYDRFQDQCISLNLFTTKINYETAKGLCESIGDGLMPLGNKAISNNLIFLTNAYHRPNPSYGRFDAVTYVGLTRKNTCTGGCDGNQNWQWSLPDLVTDDTGFTWADGFPSSDTTQKCAVSNVPADPALEKRFLESTDCSTLADGFYCHIPILPVD